ncbi:speedy protein 1-A-like [Hetaerina americana]|uniref:speedy protein 1-A-like n=1 Tax=Hetaerina americana TaxID=62018 RepID=UPI003A7F41B3
MFFALLEDQVIAAFMEHDRLCRLADKYLIAMVMTYFKRAGLSYKEYNSYNFFVALHLAHDMEEDEEELKYEFVRWLFGTNWEDKHNELLIKRDELWMAMNYRGLVIAMLPEHPIWQRLRLEVLGGAKRNVALSSSPKIPGISSLSPTSDVDEFVSSEEVDENDGLLSLKSKIQPLEEMKSYLINGCGRISCINEQDEFSHIVCSAIA